MISTQFVEEIPGWMATDELRWLGERAQQARCIVEVGCYFGKSTRMMAAHAAGVIYAIDPWRGPVVGEDGRFMFHVDEKVYEGFQKNLAIYLKHGTVKVIRDKFENAKLDDVIADFVFIDGDHRYDAIKHDIKKAIGLVKEGIISGHDYDRLDWPGIKKAVHESFPEDKINVMNSIWWVNV